MIRLICLVLHGNTKTTLHMKANIANPIYDSVFKNLMEDEFFSAIKNRDTAILQRDQTIASQKETIANLEDGLKTAVKTMLKNGMTQDMVSQAMNLTVEEITRLANA